MNAEGKNPPGLSIPAKVFADLSSGYGDVDAMRLLQAGQRSQRMLLLRAIADGFEAARSWISLLARAADRDAAQVEPVLAHPPLESWAWRCLRRKESVAYAGWLAASAALRAGHPFELALPVEAGSVTLPTLGTVIGLSEALATVAGDGDRLTVRCGSVHLEVSRPFTAAAAHWRPVTVVDVGGRGLTIEDADPHRDTFGFEVTRRLGLDELSDFGERLACAWRILEVRHPEHMRSMRESLRMIVPLVDPGDGRSVSSSARGAFGAVALSVSMPADGLALQILHEFMHMKLWALLDLVVLHREGGKAIHFAPWRSDPRTVPALLQGAFAHLGVTDYWRVCRRNTSGEDRREAELQFVFWLEQTRVAVAALLDSGELTEEGIRFVRGLGATLAEWAAEPVPAEVRHTARDLVTVAAVGWRLRNTRPRARYIAFLLRLRAGGRRRPARLERARMEPAAASGWQPSTLEQLVRERYTKSGTVSEDPAHQAFLDGDYERARSLYRQVLRGEPKRHEAWCGLALVLARTGDTVASGSVTARPDLVRAVTSATHDDPVAVARWLGQT